MTEPPRTVQSYIDQTPAWPDGKVGAVLTAFLFPVLLADAGIHFLLSVLIASSLLGAWITSQFRIETTGVSLERIGR